MYYFAQLCVSLHGAEGAGSQCLSYCRLIPQEVVTANAAGEVDTTVVHCEVDTTEYCSTLCEAHTTKPFDETTTSTDCVANATPC